ncbi:MAG: hypothetical protein SV062_15175, partial [Thermodesulfobacteriota bacterium]|nr:hypothetical protein [Thermodesulfobacteriota bacterium]
MTGSLIDRLFFFLTTKFILYNIIHAMAVFLVLGLIIGIIILLQKRRVKNAENIGICLLLVFLSVTIFSFHYLPYIIKDSVVPSGWADGAGYYSFTHAIFEIWPMVPEYEPETNIRKCKHFFGRTFGQTKQDVGFTYPFGLFYLVATVAKLTGIELLS